MYLVKLLHEIDLSYISISWHLNYKEVVEIIATYIVSGQFWRGFFILLFSKTEATYLDNLGRQRIL